MAAGRDVRLLAIALTVLLVAGLGAAFNRLGTPATAEEAAISGTPAVNSSKNAAPVERGPAHDEVATRFRQAAMMLHAQRHEEAATALHRLLRLRPRMPEAHANMGFAMLGLGRARTAHDFFQSALALRPSQLNAYYGLAVALESIGDLAGAVGAMRTYVHRAPADDPFRRKAMSALWEWDRALGIDSRK